MSSATAEFHAATSVQHAQPREEPHGEIALFHRGLADLCRANVPLPRALRILQVDLENRSMARDVGAMADEIEQGTPLAVAYAARDKRFSPIYRALIEAGVAGGGSLPDVLDEIATHASQRAHVMERMRRALAYPVVAATFVVLIGVALMLFVTPIDRSVAGQGAGVDVNAAIDWSAWSGIGMATLLVLFGGAYAFLRRPLDEGVGPRGISYRLPLIGRMRVYATKASFAATLALLMRRAMPLPKALRLTAAATDSPEIRAKVERMAKAAESGGSLPESLGAGALISPSLAWFVESTSSERGAADALDDIATIYRQRLERSTERVAVLAAPVAQLLVGLVVLGFALSYMTSAFRVTQALPY